jgi:hypothetical protein
MLRLSHTIFHRVSGPALFSRAFEEAREVLLAAGIADHAFDLAGGDVEGGDQGLGPVTAVFEFMPLDLARHHRQVRRNPFQGLDAGLLVDGDRAMGVIGIGRGLVHRADIGGLGIEVGIGLRDQPVLEAMRFEVGLFLKNAPLTAARRVAPRRVASLRRQSRVGFNG